jgi:aminopeptidase
VVTDLEWREKTNIYFREAALHQLEWISPLLDAAYREFDAYLYIRAPFNVREGQDIDPGRRNQRSEALKPIQSIYSKRTADRVLRRCLCQYPTQAAAQEAGMSLEQYEQFVFEACKLFDGDPQTSWKQVRAEQQHLVDYMDQIDEVRYITQDTDIRFRVKGRKWMNSDGQTNMPSGEIYTAPIEDSVEGKILFTYPSVYRGHAVENIRLQVEAGEVVHWEAKSGKDLLDQIFAVEGARRFGEVAIGTNYHIKRATRNILFDEKIGGTIHMAVGQAYFQTGGKNQSAIHWDMITDMQAQGQIWADGNLIYEKGMFLI